MVEWVAPARFGKGFRWLLGSSWASNLGDGVAYAAGPLLMASLTDDPVAVSLAALLGWAPQLVFGLSAGVLSDRWDRRGIVLTGNAVRLVVLAALVVSLATGRASVVTVLAALGLLAVAEVFVDNASATLLPMLVGPDDLPTANARLGVGFITLNQLAGPAVGAVLFAAGRGWPFAVQGVLVLAGVLLVARLRLPAYERPVARNLWRDVVEGVVWTWRHAPVRTLALTIMVFNVTFGAAFSVWVLLARERLGVGRRVSVCW